MGDLEPWVTALAPENRSFALWWQEWRGVFWLGVDCEMAIALTGLTVGASEFSDLATEFSDRLSELRFFG
ncbi:MAG: hypothetical protein WBA10_06970, partial [Elainellaceae cyanobacterium]